MDLRCRPEADLCANIVLCHVAQVLIDDEAHDEDNHQSEAQPGKNLKATLEMLTNHSDFSESENEIGYSGRTGKVKK